MTKLSDLFDPAALDAALVEKLVRWQTHPIEALIILNYTELAMYSRTWTPVTKQCRGLIAHSGTGEIVARAFDKFFNYGQHDADDMPDLDLSAAVEVTDKQDGSLGILYETSTGPAIATRGSFTSDQALHATEVYLDRYAGKWTPFPGWTYLFEIVFPANRIVLNYGDMDDLVLLAAVRIDDGYVVGPQDTICEDWPGPRTEVFPYATLAEALTAEPRPNAEGFVVRYTDGPLAGTMTKLKQEDYVRLHALATKTSTTTVWEALRDGKKLIDQRELVPDEFLLWVDKWSADLTAAKDAHLAGAHAAFAAMPVGVERKTFAIEAAKSPYRAELFRLLDGRDIEEMAWKAVRPAWEPARMISEDVA